MSDMIFRLTSRSTLPGDLQKPQHGPNGQDLGIEAGRLHRPDVGFVLVFLLLFGRLPLLVKGILLLGDG